MKQAASKFGYHLHYALKANANPQLLGPIAAAGFGADCVSGNEVLRALQTGFNPDSIVFAGVGKSDREIIDALEGNIHSFNCESIQEIRVINSLATQMHVKARISLRLNPNVSAHTHKYITTGLEENKFGINPWELDEVLNELPELKKYS